MNANATIEIEYLKSLIEQRDRDLVAALRRAREAKELATRALAFLGDMTGRMVPPLRRREAIIAHETLTLRLKSL